MKKPLSLMLAAALALSLAACGGGGDSSQSGGSTPETTQSSADVLPEETSGGDEEQSPEAEFITSTVGETITLDGVDIELTTGEFLSDADKLGGNISVSTHSDSNKYFWLSGTMTNVGKETISSWSVDCIVNIIFDDDYTYEGSLNIRDDMGPFAESEVLFWADVPPAMLERYETVKVQFAYNDGFADYDWEAANYEKEMGGYDHQYEFVLGEGGGSGGSGSGSSGGAEDSMKTIAVGETITTDDFEFTLNKVELTYELKPSNTSSVYTSYEAESGKVYVHVDGTYTNTSKKDMQIRDLCQPEVDYDGGYTYSGFAVVDKDDNSFTWASSYVICTPLDSCHYHGLVECPEVVDQSDAPLYVTMKLGNETYRYDIR